MESKVRTLAILLNFCRERPPRSPSSLPIRSARSNPTSSATSPVRRNAAALTRPLIKLCDEDRASCIVDIDSDSHGDEEEEDNSTQDNSTRENSEDLDLDLDNNQTGLDPGMPLQYPIFLPMDRDYEAKYLFHYRQMRKRGKTLQDRVYVFLEHPIGWACFLYHIGV